MASLSASASASAFHFLDPDMGKVRSNHYNRRNLQDIQHLAEDMP